MHFVVDENKKVIFGFSTKCGYTHLRVLYNFLFDYINENTTDFSYGKLRHIPFYNRPPQNYTDYTMIIIIRNPYLRIVSGFLDKYKKNTIFRMKYGNEDLCFYDFVNELVNYKYRKIDKLHFEPQLFNYDELNPIITSSKLRNPKTFNYNNFFQDQEIFAHQNLNLKIFDISNIDYQYIGNLYNKTIPETIKNFKGYHSYNPTDTEDIENNPIYKNIDSYINKKINYSDFYNSEIKEKIFNFYKTDFEFFKLKGFDYDI